jgi:hypothetical protein
MRRGTFLLAVGGLGASLAWRAGGLWPFLRRDQAPSERLAALLRHEEGARAIGREYLRRVPAEASSSVLTARVAERLPGGLGAVDTVSQDRLRELLLRASADDFHELRTVEVQGWVLARTEARLCALAALRAPAVRV